MNTMTRGMSPTLARTGWTCQVRASLPMLTLATAKQRGVLATYRLEPRRGPIAFSLQRLGLFALSGEAAVYSGLVVVDMELCRITGIDLTIDPVGLRLTPAERTPPAAASSLEQRMGWLPRLRYKSLARAMPQDRELRGLLDLGGTPRLQILQTLAASRHADRITGTDLAMFDLTAEVALSQLTNGLVRTLAGESARLHLTITAEIEPAG